MFLPSKTPSAANLPSRKGYAIDYVIIVEGTEYPNTFYTKANNADQAQNILKQKIKADEITGFVIKETRPVYYCTCKRFGILGHSTYKDVCPRCHHIILNK